MNILHTLTKFLNTRCEYPVSSMPSVEDVQKEANQRGLPFEMVAEEYRLEHIQQLQHAQIYYLNKLF